jgi:hypothetical protein
MERMYDPRLIKALSRLYASARPCHFGVATAAFSCEMQMKSQPLCEAHDRRLLASVEWPVEFDRSSQTAEDLGIGTRGSVVFGPSVAAFAGLYEMWDWRGFRAIRALSESSHP